MLKPELLAAGFVCCVALVAPAAPFLLGPAHAQQAEAGLTQPLEASPATALADLLRMDETFAIMADEGRAHGAEIESGTFPGRGGVGWAATVDRIYDQGGMRVRFLAAFEAALKDDPAAIQAAQAFFGSELGQRILTLELDARRAMGNEDVSEAAEVTAEKMKAARDPRLRLVRKMIEAGDLVEMNVAGALSANLAFARGMAETLPKAQAQPLDDMMTEVWGQEGALRASTTTWLYSYLVMAYAPLSDAEMQSYVDFWASPEGKRLNAALFTAFDAAFVPVSAELGSAVGAMAQSRDI